MASRIALVLVSSALALAAVECLLARFLPDAGRPVTQVIQLAGPDERYFDFYARRVLLRTDEIGYLHDPADPLYTAYGIAGKGTPLARIGDEFRILFLGDSVAEWDDGGQGFVRATERRLAAATGAPVVALNAAHAGYSLVHQRAWFAAFGAKVDPDLVIVCFVNNDFTPPETWRLIGGTLEVRFATPDPVPLLVDFGAWNDLLLGRLRTPALLFRGIAPTLTRAGWIDPPPLFEVEEVRALERLRDLRDRARALGARLAMVHFPYGIEWNGYRAHPDFRYHEILDRFARREGIPRLDLLEDFARHPMGELFLADEVRDWPVAVHPNAAGHRIAAEAVTRFLLGEGLVPAPRSAPKGERP